MRAKLMLAATALAMIFVGVASVGEAQRLGDGDGPKARRQEPLVDRVRTAIERAVQYLRDQQQRNGSWEIDELISAGRPGGETSLVVLALLNAGLKPDDAAVARGLEYLRGVKTKHTYVVALQTMVFAAAGKDVDRERIQQNVDWLVKARVFHGNTLVGWGYTANGADSDNSNTQYALLGLHEGHQAGAKIDREVWESIREFYIRTQKPNGSWPYKIQQRDGILTMTTAGLCGLYIVGMELNDGREKLRFDGSADNCGVYEENQPVQKAHSWIARGYRLDFSMAPFYNLYGIERTGRYSGQRFLGEHDWYREGCEYLVGQQIKDDGSWRGRAGHDAWPVVATSFSLLFLSKGRTPILVSKLVHGPGQDWNNDRYDVRNWVGRATKEMFKRQPLAWQIFDAKRARIETRNDLLDLVGELLQSPIAYFNGHEAPEFNENEEKLLKEYIEQGGFLLAEACCNSPRFDAGFRVLMQRLFPNNPLRPLQAEHPLWRAHALVPPGSFGLEGIEMGCKTVVVYSPQDLSCWWEANRTDVERGVLAFRTGDNIIAYATGMELPKPRLTKIEVIRGQDDQKKVPRGYLKVAQIRHDGDWQPAPKAMQNLMYYLKDKPRLDVVLQTEPIRLTHPDLPDFKFLYLHGRQEFTFTDDEIDSLRADLKTGGLLLADACCGRKAFDGAFRVLAAKLLPNAKLETIPLSDEIFSAELNGAAIKQVRCRRERPDGSAEPELKETPPFLEGIRHNNRWVVIYSKYDLGCALEKHQSSDCLGHDYDSALKLGSAAVYYAMKR